MKKLWYICLMSLILTACKEEKIITSEFTDGPKPTTSFTYAKDYLKVTFHSTSANAESFYWDFGDGAYSTEESPEHIYAASGTYDVSLKVNSAAGYSVFEKASIYVAGAATPFFEYFTNMPSLLVRFDASKSSDIKSAKWDFGDGSPQVEGLNVTHEFADYGKFMVKLTVTGLLDDVKELTREVSVGEPVVVSYTYSAGILRNVNFDAGASKNVKSINWNFGDGSPDVQGGKVMHSFPADGTYKVTLTLTGVLDDVEVREFDVVVVANYNLFKGSNMEVEDAQYWTVISNNAVPNQFNIGTWTVTFGYTDDKPSGGSGGCLSLTNINSTRIYIYQVVDVVAGQNYKLSMDMKIGANPGSNFYRTFIGPADSPPAYGTSNPIGAVRGEYASSDTSPAFDGNTFDAASPFNTAAKTLWTAPSTGKFYVGFGFYAGANRSGRILYDNVKFELIP